MDLFPMQATDHHRHAHEPCDVNNAQAQIVDLDTDIFS